MTHAGDVRAGVDVDDLALLRDLLIAVPGAHLVCDLRGRLLATDPATLRLLPPAARDEGASLTAVADPEHVAGLLERFAVSSTPRPGRLVLTDGRSLRADGARIGRRPLLLVRLDERTRGAAGFLDISARLRSDNLQALSHRLDAAVAELHASNQRLAAANEELQQYAAAVAHDVRTPLFAMRGFAQMLREGDHLDATGRQLVDLLLESSDRLHQTTESLLAVARLDLEPVADEPVDTTAVVQDALIDLEHELEPDDRIVVGDDLPAVAVHPVALRQVTQNLVSNSLRYRSNERPLEVCIGGRVLDDGRAEIRVRDNGSGIEPTQLEHLFELFQRGTRTRDSSGHGVGLATCRKLVQRWGGTITCVDVEGPGACFVFTAPTRPPRRDTRLV